MTMPTHQPNVTSPADLRQLLAAYDVRPSKRLGQSFLIDGNIVGKILRAGEVAEADRVFEVGPGAGALTVALAARAGEVVALELDRRLVALLQSLLVAAPNVRIVQGDILRTDLHELLGDGTWKLLANLPYSIIGPAIARLLEFRALFPFMLLMTQREVAERLTAVPGTKEYGVLSVLAQAHMRVEVAAQVARSCFFPAPEVDSTVVRLTVRGDRAMTADLERTFVTVVRAVFRQRRKTLVNALAAAVEFGLDREGAKAVVEAAGVDIMRRPGSLSAEEFVQVAEVVKGGE